MLIKRHKPDLAIGRCCWVCGKMGGSGFTTALRNAGYDVPRGTMAYAHNRCMMRAARKAALKEPADAPDTKESLDLGND